MTDDLATQLLLATIATQVQADREAAYHRCITASDRCTERRALRDELNGAGGGPDAGDARADAITTILPSVYVAAVIDQLYQDGGIKYAANLAPDSGGRRLLRDHPSDMYAFMSYADMADLAIAEVVFDAAAAATAAPELVELIREMLITAFEKYQVNAGYLESRDYI